MPALGHVETSRRNFLALCAAAAGAGMLPSVLRLDALRAYAQVSFAFTPPERRVLVSAANTIVPGATVQTRYGPRAIPGAGDAGAALFIENLLTGAMIYAAGTQRPDYAMPPGTHASPFPGPGQLAMWAVKRAGWFGDVARPPHRPAPWPSELARLQGLYRAGIASLNGAVQPAASSFDAAPQPVREAVLRKLQQTEVTAYNGAGEGGQPFFLTLLDHVAQACFGDPVYGGNGGNKPPGHRWRWIYWKMVGFNGPSYTAFAGKLPGNGWTAAEMSAPFHPTIPF
jgi:hypothetical protein